MNHFIRFSIYATFFFCKPWIGHKCYETHLGHNGCYRLDVHNDQNMPAAVPHDERGCCG